MARCKYEKSYNAKKRSARVFPERCAVGGDGGNLPPVTIPLPEAISPLPRVWKPIDGFPELPAAQHQVALGRLQRAVPEQFLDRPQVGAVA